MPPRKKQRTGDALYSAAVVPRRTTRAAAKATVNGVGPVGGEDVGPATVATRLVPRTTASDASRRIVRKGRLQALPDLPLEIQFDIYNQLGLGDLLNLSRTCKKFRAFFLNKNLEPRLWAPARANTPGIPARPPWMSEPAFVHLLYSQNCYSCGAPNVRDVVYGCFVRSCKACLRDRSTIWYQDAAAEAHKIDKRMLDRFFAPHMLGTIFNVQRGSRRGNDQTYNRLLRVAVDRIFEQYRALPASAAQDADALYLQVMANDKARRPYADAIFTWLENQEEDRKARLEDTRQQRFDVILTRLRESGWDKELDFLGPEGIEGMSNMPVVRQSAKLTKGVWQKVRAALDDFLNSTRTERLDKELRAALTARFAALEDAITAHYVTLPRTARMDYRPQYIDLAFTPECRALVDVPTSAPTVTVDQFAAVVPALAEQWEEGLRAAFLAYLLPHLGDVPADVDPFTLAIAVFNVKEHLYRGPIASMRYPTILCYANSRGRSSICRIARCMSAAEFYQDDVYTRTVHALGWTSWDFKQLSAPPAWGVAMHVPFHLEWMAGPADAARAVEGMRRIVSALGLDPARVTFDDLERCDLYLRCVTCETIYTDNPPWARSWRAAYNHDERHVLGRQCTPKTIPTWRCVNDEDMEKVRALRADRRSKGDFNASALWSCALCPAFDATWWGMSAHLEKTHKIADASQAEADGVIYLHATSHKSGIFKAEVRLVT